MPMAWPGLRQPHLPWARHKGFEEAMSRNHGLGLRFQEKSGGNPRIAVLDLENENIMDTSATLLNLRLRGPLIVVSILRC